MQFVELLQDEMYMMLIILVHPTSNPTINPTSYGASNRTLYGSLDRILCIISVGDIFDAAYNTFDGGIGDEYDDIKVCIVCYVYIYDIVGNLFVYTECIWGDWGGMVLAFVVYIVVDGGGKGEWNVNI